MPTFTHRTARIGRRDFLKEKDLKEPATASPVSRRRSSSSAVAEDADQYGLSQLFQPDNVPRGMEGYVKTEDSSVRTKFKVAHLHWACGLSV